MNTADRAKIADNLLLALKQLDPDIESAVLITTTPSDEDSSRCLMACRGADREQIEEILQSLLDNLDSQIDVYIQTH